MRHEVEFNSGGPPDPLRRLAAWLGRHRRLAIVISLGVLVLGGVLLGQLLPSTGGRGAAPRAPSNRGTSSPASRVGEVFQPLVAGPFSEERTGATLLLQARSISGQPWFAVDIDRGEVRDLDLTGPESQPTLVAGSSLVVVREGTAYVQEFPVSEGQRALGRADEVFLSVTEGRVWLAWADSDAVWSLREVGLDGAEPTPTTRLPSGMRPVGVLENGLLIAGSEGQLRGLEVWDPVRHRVAIRRSLGGVGELVDMRDTLVAWVEVSREPWRLHITDLSQGTDLTIPRPPDAVGTWTSEGAFSPDGKWLGMVFTEGQTEFTSPAAIVDVARRSSRLLTGTRDIYADCYVCVAWSPNGQWAFFHGARPDGGEGIVAFSLRSQRAVRLGFRARTLVPKVLIVGTNGERSEG